MCASESRFRRFTFVDGQSPFLSDADASTESAGSACTQRSNGSYSSGAPSPPDNGIAHLPSALPAPPSAWPTEAIARVHISQLDPAMFEAQFRSLGVPVIIEGALDRKHDWSLRAFSGSFAPDASYQCRVHGGDQYATAPWRWSGKSHARHVITTTPGRFADTIASGVAARDDFLGEVATARG